MIVDKYHIIITNLDAHTIDLEPFQFGGANITTLRIIDTTSPPLAGYAEYVNKLAEAEKSEAEDSKDEAENENGEENNGYEEKGEPSEDEENKEEEGEGENPDDAAATEDEEAEEEGDDKKNTFTLRFRF